MNNGLGRIWKDADMCEFKAGQERHEILIRVVYLRTEP